MKIEQFGELDSGERISLFTLTSADGVEVKVINYGGIITSVNVPDRNGNPGNVVLGFDNLEDYLNSEVYLGALIGRYGNRIAGGRFHLGGKEFQLTQNDGNNHLHGGEKGFHKVVWDAEPLDDQTLQLSYLSPDGEEGYPGNLKVKATYRLEGNRLTLAFQARTDQATPVNLTGHSYFNLTGSPSDTVLDHTLQLYADKMTPVDGELIPTGELTEVAGTPFDFIMPKRIGSRIGSVEGGYDHNYVLDKGGDTLGEAATLSDPVSGRVLTVITTEPAIQFYSGNFLDSSLSGPDGTPFCKYSGLCLEPQHFPDSPNHPGFPSTLLNPGESFQSEISYLFHQMDDDPSLSS